MLLNNAPMIMGTSLQTVQLVDAAGKTFAATVPDLINGVHCLPSQHSIEGLLGLNIAQKAYPWETVANWTHQLPKTTTDFWMDGIGRDQFFHRWKGHHIFKDGLTVLNSPDLSAADFAKHLGLDMITAHGIPVIPDTTVTVLSKALGTSVHKVIPWTQMNIFDMAIGVLATSNSLHDIFLAITGHMPWGLQTAVFTYGLGTAEFFGGLSAQQPLLIGAGLGEYVAGGTSMWHYYAQPFVFGIPLSEFLTGLGCGAAAGIVFSGACCLLSLGKTTTTEKITMVAKSTVASAILGALSVIGGPTLSVPIGATWGMANLAWQLGRRMEMETKAFSLTSPYAMMHYFLEVAKSEQADFASFLRSPDREQALAEYVSWIKSTEEGISIPNKGFQELLNH